MNHQTIIDLAIAEGLTFIPEANCPLARIVRKAVAMEREECAALIEPMGDWCGGHGEPRAPSPRDCAKAIRARSAA